MPVIPSRGASCTPEVPESPSRDPAAPQMWLYPLLECPVHPKSACTHPLEGGAVVPVPPQRCLVHLKNTCSPPQGTQCTPSMPVSFSWGARCTPKVPLPPPGPPAVTVPPQRCSVHPKVAYPPQGTLCTPKLPTVPPLGVPSRCLLPPKMPTPLQEAWCTPKMLTHTPPACPVHPKVAHSPPPWVPGAPQSRLHPPAMERRRPRG